MTDLSFWYSETDNGWASDELVLTGHCVVMVGLKDKGYVVVKKRNDVGGDNPKVFISKRGDVVELKLSGDATGRIIQVLTSVEPNYIRYANI